MRVATQPSVTAGEGQPHGQLQRKARAPTPGVGPHLLLINCGGLLPRLVTGPGSWDWSFQRSAVASHFLLPGCRPSHRLPFGGQAWRRWEGGRARDANIEMGRIAEEKGPGQSAGL